MAPLYPVLCCLGWLLFLSPGLRGQVTGPAPDTSFKFHPGHYVAVGPGSELAELTGLSEPALRGVNKRYLWRMLEPEKDAYDLSAIAADLDYCARHGKQLVVYLVDKAFWIKGAMPAYLKALEVRSGAQSFDPVRWHPDYVARFLALGKAIGERFDRHPNFEGIAIQETSLDMSEEDFRKYDYTPDKYRDALLEILRGLQQALPHSRVFWYQNGLHRDDGHLRQIADSISGSRIVIGGPDILPHRTWLRNTYKIYGEYKEALLLFGSAQDDSYKHHKQDTRGGVKAPVHPEGYLSMEDIFLYARDRMYVNYLFWNHYYEGQPEERTFDDALGVIRAYPAFNVR
ncbi:hypothetical protein [Lewinella sp. IMCC34191]|uniref:hypothetical protein n=1 Tax=Lewinella sp. IMCC34191 TaxID=2259172 RepID=UPI000E28547E|nr:hypothetical protein [Lewinella sp. IMCC34191]